MTPRLPAILSLAVALAACSPDPKADRDAAQPTPAAVPDNAAPGEASNAATSAPNPPRPALIGEALARAEWAKAANRAKCAPLALAGDGGAAGTPRRANFSGGWAVAFDLPGQHSAYGFAGTGLLPEDGEDYATLVDRLAKQWPLMRRWDRGDNLPAGSAAGYGLSGAEPYSAADPQGRGQQSLAYLRIPGQACSYNVWSQLGRAHLETLLGQLRVIAD